jgi:chromosome segregation ATPase
MNHKTLKYSEDEVREILNTGEGLAALILDGSRVAREQAAHHIAKRYSANAAYETITSCSHEDENKKLRWEHFQETQKLNSQIWDLSFKKPTKEFVLEYDENGIPDMEPVWDTLNAVVNAFEAMQTAYEKALSKTHDEVVEEKNDTISDLQDELQEKDQRIAELEAQRAQAQQPQPDQQLQARLDAMTKLLNKLGYGLQDIDPTASDNSIMCNDCGRYFDGGCLIHGVPEDVQAEIDAERAEQTEGQVDLDPDPNAPHGGSDDVPVVTAQPEPEETQAEIVSQWKLSWEQENQKCQHLETVLQNFRDKHQEHEQKIRDLTANLRTQERLFQEERQACTEFQMENEALKQQLADLERDVDTLTDCDEVVRELAETKTLLKIVTEAKDKVIQRNREVEQENTDLKRRIKMLEDLLVHNNIEVPA